MNKIVGIDLGTTNSLVSVMEGGEVVVIPSAEGSHLFPSVVGFTKSGERVVGEIAKRQAVSNPERTIISIKRHMGTEHKVQIDDKQFTPQEISAMVLQKIKADAEAFLGYPVDKAVITVPAYFNDSERQATKDAGVIAGLEVVRIINEPTASAMAYGLHKQDVSEKILVWDLGGGTFDVSILEIEKGSFQVMATAGDARLGGDDWDQRIMDYLVDQFKKAADIDLRTDRVAMQRIKEASENAKIQLSADTTVKISLPFIAADASGPRHLEVELTRQKFQELTQDLVDRSVEPFKKAMEDSGLALGMIHKVLLVGGSTRMPAIQDKVRKLMMGKEPSKEIDPDKVVSMGAAIQGAVLAGEVKDIVLLDVTSLSLGIETTGGVFTKIIDRNTNIPCSKARMFTTAADGQTVVEVHVLQGERPIASHNKSLGSFELRNIPPAPKGVPQIEVSFEIDSNGIVNVSAKDLATANRQKVTIASPTNLTKDEIDRMVREAAANAEEDSLRREEAQARNKAAFELDSAEKTLRELAERVQPDQTIKVREAVERLRLALQNNDVNQIKDETKVLTTEVYNMTSVVYYAAEAAHKTGAAAGAGPRGDEPSEEDLFGWFKK